MSSEHKNIVVRLFNSLGLDIRRLRPEPRPRASFASTLSQLARLGLQPKTVIDVGVAYHTEQLYEQFPKGNILLVEPLSEFEASLRMICSKYKAQYVLAAAGAGTGSATINVHSDKSRSSLLKEVVDGPSADGSPRRIPVVTIDQQCAERKLSGPYLIKVAVQGTELQVLAGAARTLQETEAVVLKALLFRSYMGGTQLYDVLSKMKEFGFVVYDMFGFVYRPLDDALFQVDMVFVREDGMFRKSHAFATPASTDVTARTNTAG